MEQVKSYDRGTLNQLKHLVHCTAVGANLKHNMKPTEDFRHVILCACIVAAARQWKASCDDPYDCVAMAYPVMIQMTELQWLIR